MPEDPPLFLPANFFLVRVASFPIDYLFSLLSEENPTKNLVEKWLKDPFFRQAIAFSSQSLSSQIRKDKINDSTVLSLLKYFSRITSRGTPYGLLAFVTWGQTSHHASSQLDFHLLTKRARPDMGWIQKYTETIFQDKAEFLNLEIQTNPIIIEQNDRYCINYFIEKTDRQAASIKKNQLTALIFSYARTPLKINDLICLIQNHFPNAGTDKIIHVIQSLLEQQFLWYTLYPKLNTPSPFQELLKKVPEKYKNDLDHIEKEINNYNLMPLEQGEEYLYDLSDHMSKKVASLRLPVQLDLGISSKQIDLPQKVLDNVAKAGEILWKLSALNLKPLPLKNYHSKFLGKYGQQRLVPLFDLLDPNKGLGLPNYEVSMRDKPLESLEVTKYQEWLRHALSKALWNKEQEIVIDDDTISQNDQKIEKADACTSIDLFFEIYAKSAEAIDSGDYQISINNYVDKGGATFGRFIDILDSEVTERLKQFYEEESKLAKDTLIVESFFLPQTSNAQNVAISPSFRSNVIDLLPGGASTLHLNQIYVGATPEFLYLTNVNGDVEYRITTTNVLVDIQAPEQLRFIRQISRERSRQIELWSWGPNSASTYLPRVRYKNIILSPAKWWTSLSLIGAKENQSVTEIMDKLSNWANQFNLPEYVYITEGDNRLLINRTYKEHIKIAAAYLKKDKKIFFIEKIGQEKANWVESYKGKHSVEYVLPLIKNQFYAKKNRAIPKISYQDHKISDRWKLPGSEWLYYKFNLPAASQSLFLERHLYPFGEKLIKEGLITQWFFIRYQDENHHIRFRIKSNNTTLFPTVFNHVYQFSQDLLETSVIQEMTISSYEREIERYGGSELIDLCEEFFCADSSLAIELLKFESAEFPIYVIGAISVLDLLEHLQFSNHTIKNFFNNTQLDKKELTGYKEWKRKIASGFVNTFGPIGGKRSAILKTIADKMKGSSVNVFSLVASLIHMHCNRLCGTEVNIENKIKVFAAHYNESSLKMDLLGIEK